MAFKQLISEQLPKISYLTILDRWMLCCLNVLFLATILCVVPSAFPEEAAADGVSARDANLFCAGVTFLLTFVIPPSFLYACALRVGDVSPRLPATDGATWYTYDFTTALWFLKPGCQDA